MSIDNQQPVDPSESDSQSRNLDSPRQNSGFLQRAIDMTEIGSTTEESRETVLTTKIPRSMKLKINTLCQFMGLSTDSLLRTSIHSIVSYAEGKNVEVKKLNGYSTNEDNTEDNTNNDFFEIEIELSVEIFEKLKNQNLILDVSNCLVLGIDFLYLRLIELNKIG
jgi:hypothetical protein